MIDKNEYWMSINFIVGSASYGELLKGMGQYLKSLKSVKSFHFSLRGVTSVDDKINLMISFRVYCEPDKQLEVREVPEAVLSSESVLNYEFDSGRLPSPQLRDGWLKGMESAANEWGNLWEWWVKNLEACSKVVLDAAEKGLFLPGEEKRKQRVHIAHLFLNMLGQLEDYDRKSIDPVSSSQEMIVPAFRDALTCVVHPLGPLARIMCGSEPIIFKVIEKDDKNSKISDPFI